MKALEGVDLTPELKQKLVDAGNKRTFAEGHRESRKYNQTEFERRQSEIQKAATERRAAEQEKHRTYIDRTAKEYNEKLAAKVRKWKDERNINAANRRVEDEHCAKLDEKYNKADADIMNQAAAYGKALQERGSQKLTLPGSLEGKLRCDNSDLCKAVLQYANPNLDHLDAVATKLQTAQRSHAARDRTKILRYNASYVPLS